MKNSIPILPGRIYQDRSTSSQFYRLLRVVHHKEYHAVKDHLVLPEGQDELIRLTFCQGVVDCCRYRIHYVITKTNRIICKVPEGLHNGLRIERLGNFNWYDVGQFRTAVLITIPRCFYRDLTFFLKKVHRPGLYGPHIRVSQYITAFGPADNLHLESDPSRYDPKEGAPPRSLWSTE